MINIQLTEDESLVLYDWLARFNEAERPQFFEDQAEERVLFDIEATLLESLEAVVASDYKSRLSDARNKVRDSTD